MNKVGSKILENNEAKQGYPATNRNLTKSRSQTLGKQDFPQPSR